MSYGQHVIENTGLHVCILVLISLFNIHLTLDIHFWIEFGTNEKQREGRAKLNYSKWL